MDHKDFWSLFETAEALGTPLFIHPQIPQKPVCDIYYSGFDDDIDLALSTYSLGWHYEAGMQFVRLAAAKVFDHFPNLQIILGHWGEVVLFYADSLTSLSKVAKLERPFIDCICQNLYVIAGGMYNLAYLKRVVDIIGVECIFFSSDYPFQYRPGGDARNFLEKLDLDTEDKEKLGKTDRQY